MTLEQPEVLLFDLGGVLIENVMFDELPYLLAEPINGYELRRRFSRSPSVQDFECGRTGAREFAVAFVSEWNLPVTPTEFLAAFASWPRGPYPGALELLDQLRSRYRLALLSNCNSVHWGRFSNIRELTEAAYSSHLLGMMKPDPLVFERVAQELDVNPSRIWFFDDARINVEVARSIGMEAHQTDGIQAVKQLIRKLDI